MKSLKRKMFKVVLLILVLGLVVFIGNWQMIISSQNTQEQTAVEEQKKQIKNETNQKLQAEIIKQQLEQANLLVKKINDTVQLGLVSYEGKYEITHDRTPDNNPWTEWLLDAKLQMTVEYRLTIAVATNQIKIDVLKTGAVRIQLNEKDFYPLLEVKKVILDEEGSILGKKYSSEETIALENLAKEGILSHVDNTKLARATQNLSRYLKQQAVRFQLPESAIQIVVMR